MNEAERISDADHLLITRMEAEVVAAGRLQAFVQNHLASVYGLKIGDSIQADRTIARSQGSEATPSDEN